ncbi:hypothetical protein N431DRAFT_551813 [Stipitochalara longipes BDJ]|nr:hypothetical protein N431DRAFT_551813 [Stipitochalara longipes BDJ]
MAYDVSPETSGFVNFRWPPICDIDLPTSEGLQGILGQGLKDGTLKSQSTCSGTNRLTARGPDENRSPATLPRAFEGMLKTTTETGDIGLFSIKPSRLPQAMGTPRRTGAGYNEEGSHKPKQSFQPFGVPYVDDRRRLPSYARDVTSEVVSMYETASQKSASRVFDDPDYRSHSMTQTSYSAYTLSNHRSYTSLRSQQDGNGLLQRPRSPFAYPARLKRPGFRPSSPALTDGGVVDYSRRAEINRATYGGHSTSSPSSLYAQKRKPPLSLRQDANRSTPSLLSQPSPPRQSPSPGVRKSDGNIAQDWSRKMNGSASGNTSPARSTLSFASTVNLYTSASGTSNTTIPGKLAPSSPLYYDYTEDFEIDDYLQAAESLGSPPLFSIDKTIHEERPAIAERYISTESRMRRSRNSVRPPSSLSPTPATPKPLENTQNCKDELLTEGQYESCQPPLGGRYTSVQQDDRRIDNKVVKLSGLGYGAQELSTRVETAFGLLPAGSFEVSVPRPELEAVTSGDLSGEVPEVCENLTPERQPMASFPQRPNAHPPRLSSLPLARRPPRCEASAASNTELNVNILSHASPTSNHLLGAFTSLTSPTRSDEVELAQGSTPTPASSSSQNRFHSSSGYKPIDMGFSGLTDLIKTLKESNRGRNSEMVQPVFTASGNPPISTPSLPNGSMLHNQNINHTQAPFVSSFNGPDAKDFHGSTQVSPSKRSQAYGGFRKGEISTLATYVGFKSANFNGQMTIQTIPRFESPMLAPKPISPARQLKLKNSVPLLMKTLPPLPPEPTVDPISPVSAFDFFDNEMPYCFSPLLPELSTDTPVQEIRHESDKAIPCPRPPVPLKEEKLNAPINSESGSGEVVIMEEQATSISSAMPQPLPRLKLKMKSCTTLRPLYPSSPDLWVGDCTYPSLTLGPKSPLAGVLQSEKPVNAKPPKFKLKITRASSSSFGTVRVNRDSGESKPVTGFHLRNHKDLFTSTAGIDHIFRQVGQHLHSRKASEASNIGSESGPPLSPMVSPNAHITLNKASVTTKLEVPGLHSITPVSSHEARSVFSDDSSHMQSHSSVRDRISHLRARIAFPYARGIGSQSFDDLTWTDRNRSEAAAPATQRPASNPHSRSKSTESRPLRHFADRVHRYRLREKVKGWLKEARLVIKSRIKSRTTTGSGQDEARS